MDTANADARTQFMALRPNEVPVLIIAFNRPDHTAELKRALAAIRPTQIYVSVDGPRAGNAKDVTNVAAVRALLQSFDWDCKVYHRFGMQNLGSRYGVQAGIDWFFDHVAAGVILEDDCLPHPDLFSFCHQMLVRYWDDSRVGSICGMNVLGKRQDIVAKAMLGDASYTFVRNAESLGWATWRRAWQLYDRNFDSTKKLSIQMFVQSIFLRTRDRKFIENKMRETAQGIFRDTCWDYQWYYTHWLQNMLCIVPRNNLVHNIGFEGEGVHTGSLTRSHPLAFIPTKPLPESGLQHPVGVYANLLFDQYALDYVYNPKGWRRFEQGLRDKWYQLQLKFKLKTKN